MSLLADRFLRCHAAWFDLATGEQVRVLTRPAGPLRDQIAWAEACDMLASLRHPLLNPLLDFGAADRATLFEAYAARTALAVTPVTASRLVAHAGRFLAAHGIAVTAEAACRVFRPVRFSSASVRGRPVGIVLQPRAILDLLREVLGEPPARGTTEIRIAGPPGSGVRTLRARVARLARMEGYVPLCPAALARWPDVARQVAGRHVCILADGVSPAGVRRQLAAFLALLAMRSARSHIYLTFGASGRTESATTTPLERMGTKTMASMVYRDAEWGPSLEEIFEAARRAEGRPGEFLTALRAHGFERRAAGPQTVHESHAEYGEARAAGEDGRRAPPPRARLACVLTGAGVRAAALERRGRHAAAARLLARAARVLEGRGDRLQAAHRWLQAAWLARTRGGTAKACDLAERARHADSPAEIRVAAAHLTAVCWTDEGRLIEAEASLRTLMVAASALADTLLVHRCRLALARVLCWDGKGHEALAVLQPALTAEDAGTACEALTRCSRAHLQAAELPNAVGMACEAVRRAAALRDSRLQAAAHCAMAEAMLAAGDLDAVHSHVAAGLAAARAARLPLSILRLRAVLLRALVDREAGSRDAVRLRLSVERALRRALPGLLRRRLEAACRLPVAAYAQESTWSRQATADVEAFLETAQRAEDDRTAVVDVLTALCARASGIAAAVVARDGRVVAAAGKPWRDRSVVVSQVLASGEPAAGDGQPLECADPVRCGGELIAALGCRWVPGASPLPRVRAATLRAASMAIATHVRALVDSVAPDPPPAVWGDLLGDSAVAAALRDAALRASRAPFNVLVEGESGVGKELVARAIHRLSARHTRRFCAINCAALSDELVEAELFGHTRGAFTGAMTERAGLFEEADGGTLFLDEVGELSARAQAKLLRVIQEGEVRRVGENLPRRVDVRIVSATNRKLEEEAACGRFRTDLRFRLDVLRIVVPPLRERIGDIPVLAQHFWVQATARVGSHATLGPDALSALSRYDWPGNVRELQNAIAWMAVHAPRRGRVSAAMLPAQLASRTLATGSFEAAREEFERRFVRAALAQAGGQRQKAARALGVSRQGLAKMLRRLGIEQNGVR